MKRKMCKRARLRAVDCAASLSPTVARQPFQAKKHALVLSEFSSGVVTMTTRTRHPSFFGYALP